MSDGERRLAAIMYTDMVGYTALGQRNEALSLALVEEQRRLIRPILARHNGREIKTMGDAFLVEFPSALDSVRCGYDIQRATREFNFSLPIDKRIHLRIGLHLGDVVELGGDISGDAVNVASRIEPLADDGGVCLTRQVYDQVQNKFELPLVSIGQKNLKNVSAPIEVYSMKMPWPKETAVIAERLDKKKIAILPLASISHDPNDEYFADGLTEELIGTMSKIGELRVISRTSIMQYKGRSEAISRIATELGAGTVLEGSVRKEGSRVRVSMQMIDANEDNHVWAENYDGEIRDIFSMQSDIADKVAKATKVNILDDEKTRIGKIPTRSMAAYESYLRARYLMNKGAPSPHSLLESVKYLEEAIRLDQEFSLAYATLGNLYVIIGGEWMPLREAIAKAEPLIAKALEMDSNLADAHVAKGNLAFQHHLDYETAEKEFRRAIDLNPSNVDARGLYSFLLQVTGDLDGAMREAVIAQELDPVSPWALMSLLSCLVLKKAYPEALALCEKMMQLEPENPSHHLSVASLYFHMGRPDDCKREVELAERLKIGVNERADLAECLALLGRESDARRLLHENEDERRKLHLSIGPLAFVYMALGDTEKALQILEEDVSVDPVTFLFSYQSRALDPLRGDPRFSALVEMLKLPKKS